MKPHLPNIELIESQHKFPGTYLFKIIGDNYENFVTDALTLTLDALKDQDRACSHSSRLSAAGNHIALTLSVEVETAQEVHAIYEKLLELKGVRALF